MNSRSFPFGKLRVRMTAPGSEPRTEGRWVPQGVKLRNEPKRLFWLNKM